MYKKRLSNLIAALLLAGIPSAFPPAASAASVGSHSINQLAGSVAMAAGPGLRREVFGFANAGNLGSASVGYTTWNFSLLSTVAFFGLRVNGVDGALVPGDAAWNVYHSATMGGFVGAAHAAGARVIVSINLQDFSGAATNQTCQGLAPGAAQNTINQAVAKMAAAGVDGINVDYEGVNTTCANGQSSRAQLVGLVTKLRAAMPKGTYLAIDTYAGSAEDPTGFFDIPGLAPQVDALFVMAYDMDYSNYHYAPLNCASFCFSPVSPLDTYRYNDTLTSQQYSALVPANKVILGLPYYGRKGCVPSLNIAHQYPTRFDSPYYVAPTYLYAVEVPRDTGVSSFSAHRDPSDGVSEWDTWYSTDFSCNREQYWDDVQSLGAKYDLVDRYNLGGVGLFTLDYGGGSPELWSLLASKFACPANWLAAGDFRGVAKSDLVVGTTGACVMQSTGTNFASPKPWTSAPFYGTKATLVGGVTGSGKADLVAVSANETWVMPSTGTGFATPVVWSKTPFYGTQGTFLADVNGDGKADVLAVNADTVWVMLSTGTSFGPPQVWSKLPFTGDVGILVDDVTGDHKADVIAINHNNTWVMTSTGSGFSAPKLWSDQPFYGTVTTLSGAVSGSGKADLVAVNNGSIWVMRSTGTGFAPPAIWLNAPCFGNTGTIIADVNGDGKADLVAVNDSSVWVTMSTGTGFAAPALWYAGPP
jgi:hypothetical protein